MFGFTLIYPNEISNVIRNYAGYGLSMIAFT